jgi:hypothetical protein
VHGRVEDVAAALHLAPPAASAPSSHPRLGAVGAVGAARALSHGDSAVSLAV